MRRREFITLLGGAVAAWPLAAHAQQTERMRRIGVLAGQAESDHEAQSWVAAFREELQKLGWTEGRNIEIDTRWARADVESMKRFAKELVALQPDFILTSSTPATAAMLQQTRTIPIIFVLCAARRWKRMFESADVECVTLRPKVNAIAAVTSSPATKKRTSIICKGSKRHPVSSRATWCRRTAGGSILPIRACPTLQSIHLFPYESLGRDQVDRTIQKNQKRLPKHCHWPNQVIVLFRK
jgi:hypothetical protein